MITLSDDRRRITMPPGEPKKSAYQIVKEGEGRFLVLRLKQPKKGSLLNFCRMLGRLPESRITEKLSDW